MKRKKLAIIGIPRSEYTLNQAILEAIEMNLIVYLVASKEDLGDLDNRLLYKEVNIIENSLQNEDDVAELLKGNEINLVISLTEFMLPFAAEIRERLNILGESVSVELLVKDKFSTRDLLYKKELSKIKYKKVSDIKELLSLSREQYPFILKPNDLTGSIGVRYIENIQDLENAVNLYRSNEMVKKREFLLEEFIDGVEISVEGLVVQGKLYMFAITDKRTTGKPFFVEIGHTVPSVLGNQKSQICDFLTQVIRALGINCSPIHAELKITNDCSFELIEIHTRYGGDMITKLVSDTYNYKLFGSYYEALLTGKPPTMRNVVKTVSSVEYIFCTEGIIKKFDFPKSCEVMANITEVNILKKEGDQVQGGLFPFERIGYFITHCQSNNSSNDLIKRIRKNIVIEMLGGENN
ncbi:MULTISPECIES: acetyl-CoA carboxylase biotin carboxylase subunit family protein [unclassified Bacillus cereus group]|uniref:ATP-grasp domain-containing protein n=1 Tax=unclassified Bacillus cereus group TaxID=2750818 RepID=UPI001F5739EC|nr:MULTISPECIES: ATP-grasp domain-containing protein [unclassified Bacillus cereus group]